MLFSFSTFIQELCNFKILIDFRVKKKKKQQWLMKILGKNEIVDYV